MKLEAIAKDPQLSFLSAIREQFPDAEWFVVGGAVRDALIGRAGRKDYDLVVRHAALAELQEALRGHGAVNLVGKRFGVLKFRPSAGEDGGEIDISWPRTERAGMSGGYRDFSVQSDPELPIEEDLGRRDFTMNAMAWDLQRLEIVDPFGGRQDIGDKVIRAVGAPAVRFREDYSRMLRAIRFACELGFEIETNTWEGIRAHIAHINDNDAEKERIVPRETIAREMVKAFAADPARAVGLFEKSGALFLLIPEIGRLSVCAQSPEHHSEGDVWTHTKLAIGNLRSSGFAETFPGETADAETAFAVLLHDIAKPQTAAREGDRITFYGHSERGADIAGAIAERLTLSSVPGAGIDADRLSWFVKMHLLPNSIDAGAVKKTTLVKHFLADRGKGRKLLHVAFADASASIPAGGKPDLSNLRRLLSSLAELEMRVETDKGAPKKLLSGEEVMELTGLAPGPEIGRILELLEEAQLSGEVATAEEAMAFLKVVHE